MKTREAHVSDFEEIAQLTSELGYAADSTAIRMRLTQLIGESDQLVVVVEHEQKVVGWLQAHASTVLESGFRVEIVGLIVAEKCRRRGVGRALVLRATQWASEIGAAAVVVRSNVVRTESHRFYPALGFLAAKTQAVYRLELSKTLN